MMKHMALQTTVENYLKDKVPPVSFDFSGEKKTMVDLTKDASKKYFERIKYHYSDYDMMSVYDMIDILLESGEMKAALSLEIPKSSLLNDDEKIRLVQSLLEKNTGDAADAFNQMGVFSDDLAYQSLCNFLMKQNCFTEKYMSYLFMEDKYSDASEIIDNFRYVVDAVLPQKVKCEYLIMLPSLIRMENVPKVEFIKSITQVFLETKTISEGDKKTLLEAFLHRDVDFFTNYFGSSDNVKMLLFQGRLWRETITLRYFAKTYLSLSSVNLHDFFAEHHEGGHSHDKQQILLGLFDFIREHYNLRKIEYKQLLQMGVKSKYPTIRKTSYELLFALDDGLEESARVCVHDPAMDVRKTLGDVALSNTKYKDLNPQRRKKLVQLTLKYRDRLNLTHKQQTRLKTYEN